MTSFAPEWGDLAARFEELKRKLHTEGLFSEEHKQRPPAVAGNIGIVTGIATAALQDVLNVLRRRAPYLNVVIFPTSVQGDKAAPEVIEALKTADSYPGLDTILLVRGGGSLEDLWCFNDEKLARVIHAMQTPVITGVGHEIDYTIVDFVADHRAPTPSAAAELVTPDAVDLQAAVGDRTQRLIRAAIGGIDDAGDEIARLFDHRLIRDVVGRVDEHSQAVDDLSSDLAALAAAHSGLDSESPMAMLLDRMATLTNRALEDAAHRTPRLAGDFLRSGRQQLDQQHSRIDNLSRRLKALDPRAPLSLGFSLVWDEEGALVRDAGKVKQNQKLRVQPAEGEMQVRREDGDA